MSWYNEKGEKAPASIIVIRDGKRVWRCNPAADAEWREENGYIYDTPPPKTIYTKLQIRRAMRALGWEDTLDTLIESSHDFKRDWNDAQVIDLADPVMVQALAAGGVTQEEIEAIREKIEEMEGEPKVGEEEA